MEWEQIADKWAAMARRLRNDRSVGGETLRVSGEVYRVATAIGSQTLGSPAPDRGGNDNNLPTNQ